MKNYFLLLIVTIAITSCKTTVKDQLIGTWTMKSSHKQRVDFDVDPLERVEKSMVTMYYHFYEDGKFKIESDYTEIGTIAEGEWEYDKDYKELKFTKSSLNMTFKVCLLYTSPSPRDQRGSRMPSSA